MHCIVMTKVWGFNVPDVYEEIGLVLSYQDLDQFQKMGNGVEAVKINAILKYAPMPIQIKQFIIGKMMSVSHSILGDKTVFLLMVLLLLFDDPDPSIIRIREQYQRMLTRYLQKKFAPDLCQQLLKAIYHCLNNLPEMAVPFKQMMSAPPPVPPH